MEVYCEGVTSVHWERFFTNLLIEKTNGTYLQYTKKNINDAYLNDKISSKIVKSIKSIDFLSRNVGVESDNVGVEVTLTEQNILLCLKSDPSLSMLQVSEKLGCTKRTVERAVKNLKEKHLLKREGSDRYGKWLIIEN